MAYDEQKYKIQYVKENYDQVMVKIPKGKKEVLKKLAEDLDVRNHQGLISVNKLIINALERTYNIDLSKPQK